MTMREFGEEFPEEFLFCVSSAACALKIASNKWFKCAINCTADNILTKRNYSNYSPLFKNKSFNHIRSSSMLTLFSKNKMQTGI